MGPLSPTAHPRRSGNGHRYYYVCRQRYSNGPRTCPSTRNSPAAPLEHAVWRAVHRILCEPDLVLRQYDNYVESKRRRMRGDPGREARDLTERLGKLERRRSGYLDLAADGDMGREELRAKLAEVDGLREAARNALREATDRQEMIGKLKRDRKVLLGRFSAMRGVDLRTLEPEQRRRIMQALRLRVEVDKEGAVRISGMFDADITGLLPMASEAPSGDEPYRRSFSEEIPPPHKAIVTLDTTRTAACSRSQTTR